MATFFKGKTGELIRKPVSLDQINKVAKTALEQQALLVSKESVETTTQATQTIQDQIRFLAEEFAKFNTRRTITAQPKDIEDAVYDQRETRLLEATEVRLEAGEYCEEECGQQSPSDYVEGGESAQGGWEGRGSHQASEQGWDDDKSNLRVVSAHTNRSYARTSKGKMK
jgi:histone H3/H4